MYQNNIESLVPTSKKVDTVRIIFYFFKTYKVADLKQFLCQLAFSATNLSTQKRKRTVTTKYGNIDGETRSEREKGQKQILAVFFEAFLHSQASFSQKPGLALKLGGSSHCFFLSEDWALCSLKQSPVVYLKAQSLDFFWGWRGGSREPDRAWVIFVIKKKYRKFPMSAC